MHVPQLRDYRQLSMPRSTKHEDGILPVTVPMVVVHMIRTSQMFSKTCGAVEMHLSANHEDLSFVASEETSRRCGRGLSPSYGDLCGWAPGCIWSYYKRDWCGAAILTCGPGVSKRAVRTATWPSPAR